MVGDLGKSWAQKTEGTTSLHYLKNVPNCSLDNTLWALFRQFTVEVTFLR